MDHYVARGGPQRFEPNTPKGGRFLEVHVRAPPERVRFVEERCIERSYFGDPLGSFACGDEVLERIWSLGVETLRACAEDAVIDNPTRERGQWVGDVMTVAMPIAAAAYSDLRLFRRASLQTAWTAREDGMVSGLNPGGLGFLPTYALQWVDSNANHYDRLAGDLELLRDLFPHAVRNLAAFERDLGEGGLRGGLGWNFVDWVKGWDNGVPPQEPNGQSVPVSLTFALALGEAADLEAAFGDAREAARDRALAARIVKAVRATSWDDAKKLIADTPAKRTFSQQTNALAVLADVILATSSAVILPGTT